MMRTIKVGDIVLEATPGPNRCFVWPPKLVRQLQAETSELRWFKHKKRKQLTREGAKKLKRQLEDLDYQIHQLESLLVEPEKNAKRPRSEWKSR